MSLDLNLAVLFALTFSVFSKMVEKKSLYPTCNVCMIDLTFEKLEPCRIVHPQIVLPLPVAHTQAVSAKHLHLQAVTTKAF